MVGGNKTRMKISGGPVYDSEGPTRKWRRERPSLIAKALLVFAFSASCDSESASSRELLEEVDSIENKEVRTFVEEFLNSVEVDHGRLALTGELPLINGEHVNSEAYLRRLELWARDNRVRLDSRDDFFGLVELENVPKLEIGSTRIVGQSEHRQGSLDECSIQIQNPHESAFEPGIIKVKAQAKCWTTVGAPMTSAVLNLRLEKEKGWFVFKYWSRVSESRHPRPGPRPTWGYTRTATRFPCEDGKYRSYVSVSTKHVGERDLFPATKYGPLKDVVCRPLAVWE